MNQPAGCPPNHEQPRFLAITARISRDQRFRQIILEFLEIHDASSQLVRNLLTLPRRQTKRSVRSENTKPWRRGNTPKKENPRSCSPLRRGWDIRSRI